jgi:hypothetical protein
MNTVKKIISIRRTDNSHTYAAQAANLGLEVHECDDRWLVIGKSAPMEQLLTQMTGEGFTDFSRVTATPQATPAAASTACGDFDVWEPPGLYEDRMSGDDQISLEEMVAAMIFAASDDYSRVTDERAAELGRRIVCEVLYRTRPDLFRDGDIDIFKLIAVRSPGRRVAIVELEADGEITDDLRLAENIAVALKRECQSGNGLMDAAGDGSTRQLRVWVNSDYFTQPV